MTMHAFSNVKFEIILRVCVCVLRMHACLCVHVDLVIANRSSDIQVKQNRNKIAHH
jgi:hypothetical protein